MKHLISYKISCLYSTCWLIETVLACEVEINLDSRWTIHAAHLFLSEVHSRWEYDDVRRSAVEIFCQTSSLFIILFWNRVIAVMFSAHDVCNIVLLISHCFVQRNVCVCTVSVFLETWLHSFLILALNWGEKLASCLWLSDYFSAVHCISASLIKNQGQ